MNGDKLAFKEVGKNAILTFISSAHTVKQDEFLDKLLQGKVGMVETRLHSGRRTAGEATEIKWIKPRRWEQASGAKNREDIVFILAKERSAITMSGFGETEPLKLVEYPFVGYRMNNIFIKINGHWRQFHLQEIKTSLKNYAGGNRLSQAMYI